MPRFSSHDVHAKGITKVSVVVPTYNRPAALKLCLLSLQQQSVIPEEVLVADDGSGDETRQVVAAFAGMKDCPFVVKHIWQEDAGFRKPRILNETVRNAAGDYLIFIDGDCMAHRHFVRSHLQFAEVGAMLGGKRVDIGCRLTERLIREGRMISWLTPELLFDSIVKGSRKVDEAVLVRNPYLRRMLNRDRISNDGIWGCNFSVHRDLFDKINGCDEDFLDGSIEDNDLGIRVLNSGGRLKSVRSLAVIFHLWHATSWQRDNAIYEYNKSIIDRRISLREARCVNGITRPSERGDAAPAERIVEG